MATTKRKLPIIDVEVVEVPKGTFLDKLRQQGAADSGAGTFFEEEPKITEMVLPEYHPDWDVHGPSDLETLKKPPPSVIGVITAVLENRNRDPHYFRPSGFGGCRRSQIFFYTHVPQEVPQVNATLAVILDTGTHLHTMLQQYLSEHPGLFFAKEVPVYLPEIETKGSSDGILMQRVAGPDGTIYRWGIEFKTISPDGFEALSKPKPEHVIQASIYARLMGVWWITIVYYDKGKSRFKEYHVQYDEKVWAYVKERVAFLKTHINDGTVPEFDSKECRNNIGLCRYVGFCGSIEGVDRRATSSGKTGWSK